MKLTNLAQVPFPRTGRDRNKVYNMQSTCATRNKLRTRNYETPPDRAPHLRNCEINTFRRPSFFVLLRRRMPTKDEICLAPSPMAWPYFVRCSFLVFLRRRMPTKDEIYLTPSPMAWPYFVRTSQGSGLECANERYEHIGRQFIGVSEIQFGLQP